MYCYVLSFHVIKPLSDAFGELCSTTEGFVGISVFKILRFDYIFSDILNVICFYFAFKEPHRPAPVSSDKTFILIILLDTSTKIKPK